MNLETISVRHLSRLLSWLSSSSATNLIPVCCKIFLGNVYIELHFCLSEGGKGYLFKFWRPQPVSWHYSGTNLRQIKWTHFFLGFPETQEHPGWDDFQLWSWEMCELRALTWEMHIMIQPLTCTDPRLVGQGKPCAHKYQSNENILAILCLPEGRGQRENLFSVTYLGPRTYVGRWTTHCHPYSPFTFS